MTPQNCQTCYKRAVEGVAKEANMKVKGVLCELLSEVHAELGASQFGRHVNHKLRVTDYVKNKQVGVLSRGKND